MHHLRTICPLHARVERRQQSHRRRGARLSGHLAEVADQHVFGAVLHHLLALLEDNHRAPKLRLIERLRHGGVMHRLAGVRQFLAVRLHADPGGMKLFAQIHPVVVRQLRPRSLHDVIGQPRRLRAPRWLLLVQQAPANNTQQGGVHRQRCNQKIGKLVRHGNASVPRFVSGRKEHVPRASPAQRQHLRIIAPIR